MDNPIAHILVVDDDSGIRTLVKKYLNENKFYVTTAKNAEDANEKIQIIKFDFIILDIMMPGKSGLEFIKDNKKKLEADLELFHHSIDRVASVSTDKKDGVRFSLSKNKLDLSVNNANSGDGKESLIVKFDHELDISFNSRYLIDVASQLDGEKIEIYLKDTGLPALIKDPSDFDSIYVVMPMKG